LFQSPAAGLFFHVALPAKVLLVIESRSRNISTARNNNGNRRRGPELGAASDIDEDRRLVFFIILSCRITGASSKGCRR
jgi:hypothetical protein